MLKTLAAIVLSVGLTACLDDPQTEADPQDDNAGDTQPVEGADHQDPNTLEREPIIDQDGSDDGQPGVDMPDDLVGCAPDHSEVNGTTFKETRQPGDDGQCRPIAG